MRFSVWQTDTYAVSLRKPHADTQGFSNDYIWLAGLSTITGGAGADVLTGGAGIDTFVTGSAGDSIVGVNTIAGATVAAGDTFVFAGGVDIVTDFAATDLLNTASAAGAAPTALIKGVLVAGTNYVAYGTWDAATATFTAAAAFNATTAADALLVSGDGILTGVNSTGYVVLDNLTAALAGANFV